MRQFDLTGLKSGDLPVTLRAFRADNEVEVWRKVVRRPSAVEVPPLAHREGVHVWIRMEYADGEVVEVGKSRLQRTLIGAVNKLRGR